MTSLRAAADTAEFVVHDLPAATNLRQEAPLRASVLMLESESRLCIVSCDTLGLMGDTCEEIANAISTACGVPTDQITVVATHTHHAPRAMPVYSSPRDDELCRRIVAAAVAAATSASAKLDCPHDSNDPCEAELAFFLGQEATVGANSRWVMDDGQISWSQHDEDKMVRPSGPHDPDLPVIALRRPSGELIGCLFLHSTHNIGTLAPDPATVVSPGFFGLAAQELERRHGAPFLFLPGAFGSSHRRRSEIDGAEAFTRVVNAVEDALENLRPVESTPICATKSAYEFQYRLFDEAKEAAAVRGWGRRWFTETGAENLEKTYVAVRASMADRAGKMFESSLQVLQLGELAIMAVPGELFATLALRLRQQSPFRHTFVAGLANDEIGYIADRKGYRDGGYQTWFCGHSRLEPGEGERMLDAALQMLSDAHGAD
ncbi:MAG: hypothetical protein KAI66_25700 [Lentisphaeria bacterium]|nr:hypothetical protein [Lentisphaeria bacterium]